MELRYYLQKPFPIRQITLNSEKHPGSSQLSSGFIWNLSHVPGELITTGRRIPSWQLLNDVAPIPVTDRNGLFKGAVNDSIETITLVPYGFTKVTDCSFPYSAINRKL